VEGASDEDSQRDEDPDADDIAFLDDTELEPDEPGLHARVSAQMRAGKSKKNKEAMDSDQDVPSMEPKPPSNPTAKKAKIKAGGDDDGAEKIPPKKGGGGHRKMRVGDPDLPETW
jgi:hypothetical protein